MTPTVARAAAARPAVAAREGVVLLVAAGAAFLALLDATVANLAVQDVTGHFRGASVTAATWIITLYAVTFAALLAPAGRLADVVGRRALLVAGVAGFTIMSALCAAAPSLAVLLVARALQGVAAAVMIPASLAVVLADTSPQRRAAAIGAWSAAGALAAAAGPAVGGVLVDALGWRSLFLVNLPIALTILAGARLLPASAPRSGRLPDWGGTLLLGLGVGAAAPAITQAPRWSWGDGRTAALLGGAALAIVAALVRSSRHPAPAIQIELWERRSFAWANLASLFYGAALFPWLLVGVLFLVDVWDYSALEAGLAMTPGAIVASLVALRAGPVVAARGPRPVVVAGAAVLAAAGLLCVTALPADPSFLSFWLPVGVLIGIGTGAITTGISTAAALSVDARHFAAATGLNQTARQIGGALGIAGLAAVLDGRTGDGVGPFADVYLLCTLATVAAGAVALRIVLHHPQEPA
jgi:EmrB/QacA subfamily drug resistance transporter